MRALNFIIISNRFPPNVVGGAELTAYQLGLKLLSRGHSVSAISLSDRGEMVLDNGKIDGFSIRNYNLYNQFSKNKKNAIIRVGFRLIDFFNPFVFFRLLRAIKHIAPDCIITHNLKGMGLAIWVAAYLLKVPIFHFLHDYWLICPRSTKFNNNKVCLKRCLECKVFSIGMCAMSRLPSQVMGVSNFVINAHLAEGYFKGIKTKRILNSRDLMSFESLADIVPRNRNVSSTSFNVGYIGRIEEEKGVRHLFEAMNMLDEKNWVIHIAGSDPYNLVSKYASDYPKLKYIYYGFCLPQDFYQHVDIIVVPSIWDEPLGNVAFEPWEFGIPTVVYRSGGLPEVHFEVEDLVVSSKSPVDLSKLINRLAVDYNFYNLCSKRAIEMRGYFMPERQVTEFLDAVQVFFSDELL